MEEKKQKKLTATQEKSRQKKLTEIVKDLQSSEDVVVLDALNKVKEYGDASVIPLLVEVFCKNESPEIQKSVKSVFVGLKDSNVISPLIDIIKKEKLTDEQSAFLTSSFWEAGLNVDKHLDDLIDILLEKGFLTSIEVMTIVENLTKVDNESLERNLIKRKKQLDREKTEKDGIYQSIVQLLSEHLIG